METAQIEAVAEMIASRTVRPTTSTGLNELGEALAKAQAEIKHALTNAENPHLKSKYADLASTWDACREQLSKHGLSVTQTTYANDSENIFLRTRLLHSSGQWIEGEFPVVAKDKTNPQHLGSGLTYARRYGLASIVGVAPEDDDGETAAKNGVRKPQRAEKRVTSVEAKMVRDAALANGKSKEDVLEFLQEKFKVSNSAAIPASGLAAALKWAQE